MKLASDRLCAEISVREGRAVFRLRLAGRDEWMREAPLVTLDVYADMEQRLEPPVEPVVQDITAVGDGIRLTLFARAYQIRLSVCVCLDGERLKARFPARELEEEDSAAFRLYGLHFLPGWLRVGPAGHMLLPLNCGQLFSPAHQPELRDQFLLYGEQSRWELLPMLPLVAAGERDSGFAAIATECAEDASVRVWTDGQGQGGIDMGASLRQNWIDPVDRTDREVVYTALRCEPDLLHAAAAALRRHVAEDMKVPSLRARAEVSPEVRYLFQAPTIKLKQAVRNRGIGRRHPLDEGYGEYLCATTCDEAIEMLQALRQGGIERAHVLAVGFLPDGHDGCYPSHDSFDERVGGRAGFCRMVSAGSDLGFHMNVHDNFNEGYEVSPDFDWRWCARDIYGEPQKRGRWGGGQAYLQCMLALPEGRIEGALRRMKALGLTGAGYIDAVGNPLYRNYSSEHGGPRRDHAAGIERVLRAAASVYGAVGIECGFLYAARHCVSVCLPRPHHAPLPLPAEWAVRRLGGQAVPLYNLALSGTVMQEIVFNEGNSAAQAMRALLLGLHPRVNGLCKRGIAGGTLFSGKLVRCIREVCLLCCSEFTDLMQQPLRRWEQIADGVERTAFEDGTDVMADFNRGVLQINGLTRLDAGQAR